MHACDNDFLQLKITRGLIANFCRHNKDVTVEALVYLRLKHKVY